MARQIATQSRDTKADERVASQSTTTWITETARRTPFPDLVDAFLSSSNRGFGDLLNPLTVRQREILLAYLMTRCDKAAARQLRLKEASVRNQLTAIEAVLDVESRLDLVTKCWAGVVLELLAAIERHSQNSHQA